MRSESVKAWFFLFRPWSYVATLVPFLAALALDPGGAAGRWCAGLVAGLFFQAAVNLFNTWGDERSGVDDAPGAIRTTPQVHDGLVSMRSVFAAAAACVAAACIAGLPLCLYRGAEGLEVSYPLLAAGFAGFLGCTNYSTGIKFKYLGLGVPFVAVLMGPIEMFAASALLDPATASAAPSALAWKTLGFSVPVAALVCVIMHGNDMRDMPTDRAAGIRTAATTLGVRGALALYWACHIAPYAACALMIPSRGRFMLLPFMAFPLTRRTLTAATRAYLENPQCPKWRKLERASGAIHLAFGLLYSAALFYSK